MTRPSTAVVVSGSLVAGLAAGSVSFLLARDWAVALMLALTISGTLLALSRVLRRRRKPD